MDKTTGLGQTVSERRADGGEMSLEDACIASAERMRDAVRMRTELGQIKVSDGRILLSDEDIAGVDDVAWGIFAKLLQIPLPYLKRLGSKMRALNVNYWLEQYHDKEAVVTYRNGELIEISDGIEIEKGDILDILYGAMPDGTIFNAIAQTNSVIWDVIDWSRSYGGDEKFVPGMRVVVKEGLNAPEVVPIFMSFDSCGIIECAETFEPINIKSLGYNDILHVVGERISDCINFSDGLFAAYGKVKDVDIPNARRRIRHYCEEHNLPKRVQAYALGTFDDAGLSNCNYGNIIGLFSTLGFIDEVKQSSARKLQRLAGHIVTKAMSEDRCEKCDALTLE